MGNALGCSPNNNNQYVSINCKATKILTPATTEGVKLADRTVDLMMAEIRRRRRGGVFAAVASVSVIGGVGLLMWFNGGREALLADRRGGSSRPDRA